MSVTVLEVSVEMKSQIEALLERIFPSSNDLDLVLSRTCAHVMLESARLLPEKQAERSILSSSTFVLTALLIGRRLAKEGLGSDDADLGGELVRLRDWGLLLRDEAGGAIERLAGKFFKAIPVAAKEEFEYLPEEEALANVKPGPGLLQVVRSAAESGVLTAPQLLLQMVKNDRTGIAGRLRNETILFDAILRNSAPRSGRHTQMVREARPEELALGVKDYALALATVLRSAEEEFTFALFGPWGSGKTTLISELKPLLLRPDLYRARTSAPDTEPYSTRSYQVVLHNAWKYKSRPEAWVYAYKSLADRAAGDFGAIGRLLLAIRVSAHRRGIWPIVGALVALALLSVPLAAKAQLAAFAISILGFSAFLYLGAVTSSASARVRALFARHLRISPVDERLGMLALIGDDSKALLCAWTSPRRGGRGRDGGERDGREAHGAAPDGSDRLSAPRLVLPVLTLAFVALVWATGLVGWAISSAGGGIPDRPGGLIPQSWSTATAQLLQPAAAGSPSIGEWLVFVLWCLLAAFMLVFPWCARRGRPDRVLMVIDDLDRCSAEEMLDVIEGMKLLVDDPAINSRLQILMLIDESILDHAIAHRYRAIIEERSGNAGGGDGSADAEARAAAGAAARAEIVIEQHEKLFACHLRLAPLTDSDVAAVVTSLASRELEEKRRKRGERDRQRLQRLREAASAALLDAEKSAERADAAYRKVAYRAPAELPDYLRQRNASGHFMPTNIEERFAHDPDAGVKSEERLKQNPDVVRARDSARKAKEAAAARVRALSVVSTTAASPPATDPLFDQSDVRFTAMEVEELQKLVPAYLSSLHRRRSPRAVRMLLFKIQLCRLLVQLRYPGRPAEMRSIEAILKAFALAADPKSVAGDGAETVAIARQVI